MQRSCRNHAGNNYNRFRKLYDQYGEEGLQEISRKKPLLKNRVAAEIEEAVIDYAIEYPAYGQLRAGNELKKK
ncbi:MAG: IS481 family transposase, partial [Candidatus Magnetominusculus sp. LBB02]|nr:IS481 family transposase [Candidatus Magnetominusculus sp. LBB02]